MPERRLLYARPGRLSAYGWRASTLTEEACFAATDAGIAEFSAYLVRHASTPLSLLVNVAEESYIADTIPRLGRADRAKLIQRRLAQRFASPAFTTAAADPTSFRAASMRPPATATFATAPAAPAAPLTAALSLGKNTAAPREEKLLLCALTPTPSLAAWLTALQESGSLLRSIHAEAQLGGALLQRLRIIDEHCLLLTTHGNYVRQSYCVRGQLSFSRLSPLAVEASLTAGEQDAARAADTPGATLADALINHATTLLQYLRSQRMLPREAPIRVCVLVDSQEREAVSARCVDGDALHFSIFANDDVAERCGLQCQGTEVTASDIALHLLATSPPPTQFADASRRRTYQHHRANTALRRIAIACLAAGSLATASNLVLREQNLRDAAAIRAEVRAEPQAEIGAEARSDSPAATLADAPSASPTEAATAARPRQPFPIDHATLRRIAEVQSVIDAPDNSPRALLRPISAALDSAPLIELRALDWHAADTPAILQSAAAGAPGPACVSLRGVVDAAATLAPRTALARFDEFIAALRREPDLDVAIRQSPFSGERTGGSYEREASRHFVIDLTLRQKT
ncbi:hypothetical protein GH865_08450 [Rhodocyclus tenuis]|uniref:hypothetical protein n=1 Tax=Rhodocyclus gracilis TaxID=2929842 RepID=UPI001298C9C9|nr:hypothetical protein [Rhodocyclus gracilis]MRD73279.1 hypothetical protein [Rhodocyclus gracilis]